MFYIERINLHAAGIDIGANFHFVAIGEDCAEEPVRKFGPFTSDLHRMADWLTEHHVETDGIDWGLLDTGVPNSGAERVRGKIGKRRSCEELARAQKRRL